MFVCITYSPQGLCALAQDSSEVELQRHMLGWYVYYIVLNRFRM